MMFKFNDRGKRKTDGLMVPTADQESTGQRNQRRSADRALRVTGLGLTKKPKNIWEYILFRERASEQSSN